MKPFSKFRHLLMALILVVFVTLGFVSPVLAQSNSQGTGDVTDILARVPLFPYGYATDQYGLWFKYVADNTVGAPAVVGKVLVFSPISLNWKQNATATAQLPIGLYGVVTSAALVVGGIATIQVRGLVSALCTTSGTAIAAGSMLAGDANGNLTYNAGSGLLGTVWGISESVLASSTSTATSVQVLLGGM